MDNRQNTYQQPRIPQASSINTLQNTRTQVQRHDASRRATLRGEKNSVARRIKTAALAITFIASLIFAVAGDDITGIRYINTVFLLPLYASALGLAAIYNPEGFGLDQ